MLTTSLRSIQRVRWAKARAHFARRAFLFALGAFAIQAQNRTPDFSNVDDILNGNRSLGAIQDLVVAAVVPTSPEKSALFDFTLTTANSKVNATTTGPNYSMNGVPRFQLFAGHMFKLQRAVTLHVNDLGYIYMPFPNRWVKLPIDVASSGAVADFNQDGYDDLALFAANGQLGRKFIALAADLNHPESGLKFGPRYDTADLYQALAAGDFNGDGRPEIAGLSQLASGGLALGIYTVDPQNLNIAKASSLVLNTPGASASEPVTHFSIASGRFTSPTRDQLVITFATRNGVAWLKVIDFASLSLQQPREASTLQNGSQPRPDGIIRVKTGQFNPGNGLDQIVFLFAWRGAEGQFSGTKYLDFITVDPVTLVMTMHPEGRYGFSREGCVWGFEVGNFDRRQPDPQNQGQTQHDPRSQVALLYGPCAPADPVVTNVVNILNVNPATGAWSSVSAARLPLNNPGRTLYFVACDTQGRSFALGPPTKIVLNGSAQPTAIIAVPPMHVDYIPPVGEQDPKVLNVSVIPDGFQASYSTRETSSNQSSVTTSNSWSFGTKVSGEGSVAFEVPFTVGLSAELAISAAYDHKENIDQEHGTNGAHSFDVSQQTGFSDQVWYSESRTNIYVYEVIGRTVCPWSKPNCTDSEKGPLTVQFSGPDHIHYETVEGSVLEWYQPPWEYGNVLSYPGSYSQLQKIVPDIQKLSNDQTFATDSSTLTVRTNWSAGTSEGKSMNYQNTFSGDSSLSVSTYAGDKKDPIASASLKLDFSGSYAFGGLEKNSSELGQSTGIGVTKPGTFLDPANYLYFVTPYILGRTKPLGASVDPKLPAPNTFGFIRTAFVVDPRRNGAGGWWTQAYGSAPDVALNHPKRWMVNKMDSNAPNCRAGNCAALAASSPANPWISSFHHMRGFFITNLQSPGQGPQLGAATAGDKLHLQARVYNYSFKPMPSNSTVRVRFYVQPWNSSNQMPVGDSALIGEDRLSPIPPFSTDEGAPLNWVLAKTTFDTTAYANKDVTFWVVVWMEDGSGKLLQEISAHGLLNIPGALKSLADVQPETYSNNVGFYKYIFHVFPAPAATFAGVSATAETFAAPVAPSIPLTPLYVPVNIGKVDVSANRIALGQMVEVSAALSGVNGAEAHETAILYDGDPLAGGKAIDVERANHIAAGGSHLIKTLYQPTTCGVHELFVAVARGTRYEIVRRAPPVRVTCYGTSGAAER